METWRLVPARDLGLSLGDRLRSVRRECGWIEQAAHTLWGILARVYLTVCHRFRVEGIENLPLRPPFILVANHASHLDALALGSALPWQLQGRVFPLAAGDTFFGKGPISAFAALVLNALPVWRWPRSRTNVDGLRERLLEDPCGFILFPEGTRTRTGRMGPFRKGIGRLVAGTRAPVVPCFIRGTFEAAPPRCLFPRFRKITVLVGRPLTFEAVENTPQGWRRIATEVETAVRRRGGHLAEPRG